MSVVPMTQEQMDYDAHWQMPDIKIGTQIVWHGSWNDPSKAILAFVIKVSMRSIECVTFNGNNHLIIRDVLHITDPRLTRNIHMQANGSWDYSDTEKRLRALEAVAFPKATGLREIIYGTPGSTAATIRIEPSESVSVATPILKPGKKQKQKRNFTPEQRAAAAERMRQLHLARGERRINAQEKATRDTNTALETASQ